MLRFGEVVVAGGHSEADDGLEGDAEGQTVTGADPVAEEGANNSPRDVEQIDHHRPAEYSSERGF